MNGLVIFIWLLGCGCGYWLARIQLRGRFELAADALQDARRPTPVPQPPTEEILPPVPRQDALRTYCESVPLIHPSRRVLRRFPDSRPSHFTASQIIGGYDDHGFPRSPQFPGGLEEWNRVHGFNVPADDDNS